MSQFVEPSEILGRRRLLSRGAAVAGAAAAGAVALGVAGAGPASAADGDALKQGGTYTGGTTTTLAGGSATTPALRLTNATGPALQLSPVGDDFAGDLTPGQLLATNGRILVGATDGDDSYTTALATLDDVNYTLAIPSFRLLDTRIADSRADLVAVGGPGFDSAGRLRGGSYVDVLLATADDEVALDGVFLNLTSTGSTGNGFLFAYPSGDRPVGSTTSYQKAVTTASSCLSAVGVVKDAFTVRVYTSTTSHVIVDLTGALLSPYPGPAATGRKAKAARRSVSRRMTWKPARRR